jgi:hypothetical protein
MPWHMPIIPAIGRLKQADHKLEDSLRYIPYLKKKKNRRDSNMATRGKKQKACFLK